MNYPYFNQEKKDYFSRQRMLVFVLAVLVGVIVLFVCVCLANAEEIGWGKFSNTQIVEAIGKAENSVKYPYGIKSINTNGNKDYARKICLNSVRNGRARWIKSGQPDDLIIFIGRRYSPPAINPNWVRLVKYFLEKGGAR